MENITTYSADLSTPYYILVALKAFLYNKSMLFNVSDKKPYWAEVACKKENTLCCSKSIRKIRNNEKSIRL